MSSVDAQPPESDNRSDSTSQTQGKQKWSLTDEALNKLLEAFAPDRNEAGKEYERLRTKLSRYFEWRGVGPAEDLVDETFNRAARRLEEGKEIDDVTAFIFGVARNVYKEARRRTKEAPVALDDTPESQHAAVPDPVEPDAREACFDRCLGKLLPDNRALILEYYQGERRAKIEFRQKIAEKLRIPLNALRIRAHRIRIGLEKCIRECLEAGQRRNV